MKSVIWRAGLLAAPANVSLAGATSAWISLKIGKPAANSRLFVLALATCFALAGSAAAQTGKGVEVAHAWARPTAASVPNGAVYLTIASDGTSDDRLVGASTPVASKTQPHVTIDDHGVMKMRPLADGVAIKAGQTVELKPSAMHLMLFGLKHPLKSGETFPLTLTFAKAGSVQTEVTVQMQPPSGPADMKGTSMPGMKM